MKPNHFLLYVRVCQLLHTGKAKLQQPMLFLLLDYLGVSCRVLKISVIEISSLQYKKELNDTSLVVLKVHHKKIQPHEPQALLRAVSCKNYFLSISPFRRKRASTHLTNLTAQQRGKPLMFKSLPTTTRPLNYLE